jgi:predicted nucleic acid-binding protein
LALLERLSGDDTVTMWQVACELGAVITRHVRKGTLPAEALDAIGTLRRRFPIVLPSPKVLEKGLEIHRTHQVSYWDAMHIAACAEAGVTRMYTEDNQSARVIAGVEIVNAFAS